MSVTTVNSNVLGVTSERRAGWRRVLAVAAPLPWLLLAASNAVTPDDLGGSYATQYDAFADHPAAAGAAVAFAILCAITLVPSAIAMYVALRSVAGRAATLIGGLWIVGACCGAAAASMQLITYVATQNEIDRASVIALNEAIESSSVYLVILPFALSIMLGRILLGVVLWRTRMAPRWMAVAIVAAVPVEWVLGAAIGNAGPALAYVLTAVGFASASVALTRRSHTA
ncbi:DUF4386 family protein [Nocardioides bizhenqiangii]|uniref:DUF4386 family protein n=1 Tax=Nocardioides bizhenqiangii TaxID=3095076 RepID=A0ABZ0ZQZ9_9ACTN|nr:MULTISPECIES: DUF4386 family protein [unclassified Nocardioides]MDZ5619304.1 DUF4386 family protein [Nocardioides sp. HM23]WQQ26673.1 DUF4386 family protein [Nocardioides sp. HM61]